MSDSKNSSKLNRRKRPKAKTPEVRENQMIDLAIDLAEKQLEEGTASSQVITHFLKLGTRKEKLERDILEKQKDLITAKTEAIKAAERVEEVMGAAIEAFTTYKGGPTDEEE